MQGYWLLTPEVLVLAGALVALETDQISLLGLLQEFTEGAEAVVGLVEAGFAPFQSLFGHGTPDLVRFTTFGDEGLDGLDDQVDGLLLFVFIGFAGLTAN